MSKIMEKRCLSKESLDRLIEVELSGKSLYEEDVELRDLLKAWKSWEVELIIFATSLLQILENRQKKSKDIRSLLNQFQVLIQDNGFLLEIERLDLEFIEYMFQFVRQVDTPIEQELLEIRQNLADYKYR